MKPTQLTREKWLLLKAELEKKYPLSIFAIREKTKKVLGFVPRDEKVWIPYPGYGENGAYKWVVTLDFFDEQKRTLFELKYSEYFHDNS